MDFEHGRRSRSGGAGHRFGESGEDYLACILELRDQKGYACVADVARSLSVSTGFRPQENAFGPDVS